ncbi:hypothetical protein HYQ45_004247 [Verticillium longisporum]|uniref:Uncharacterized protein n=1 Tax=Verticillium longisporum TaxID=100787 RepID=A0A0G4L6N3_VERLO|nr:hypothetical protein HYQ44_014580 [Verticillium longisporum]KAG7138652.1 hypothetical protein HYQ45_004247 [Verticillium longisporum]CRK17702.1 hypothetical protein BN1708_002985 [Verticillium longisporum]CRK26073.1 hypothetical protein BN1723_003381 [Verticillium longisporum]
MLQSLTPYDDRKNYLMMAAATWSDLPNELRWVIFDFSTSPERRGCLTLDLAVYSPSDAKHMSNGFQLTARYPYTAGVTLPTKHVRVPRPVREDACRVRCSICGRYGRRSRAFATVCVPGRPTSFGIIRVTGEEENMSPSVRVVTTLVIRCQSYRAVSSTFIAKLICTCLANLDALHSERWHCGNASDGDQSPKRNGWVPPAGPFALHPAEMLCKKAVTLRSLSAPSFLDAMDFFAYLRFKPGAAMSQARVPRFDVVPSESP